MTPAEESALRRELAETKALLDEATAAVTRKDRAIGDILKSYERWFDANPDCRNAFFKWQAEQPLPDRKSLAQLAVEPAKLSPEASARMRALLDPEGHRAAVHRALEDDGWVPVAERLPEDGVVLGYWHGSGEPIDLASYSGGNWISMVDYWTMLNPPTHWRPLPEPPKVSP